MAVIKNSTAVVWHHVNMMGEYDLTRAALRKLLNNNNNNLRFDIDKIRAWKYKNVA